MSKAPSSPKDLYGLASARAVLQAAWILNEILGRIPRRRLINYLRGNQNPPFPPGGQDPGKLHQVHGLFWSHSASWVENLIDRLAEEGYLEPNPPPSSGYLITTSGERILRGQENPGGELLPFFIRLGVHPEVEQRLRRLRFQLAAGETRPVYGIFTNSTLAHLACLQPRNLGELAAIPGMGEQRLKKYGRKILDVLNRATRPPAKSRSGN